MADSYGFRAVCAEKPGGRRQAVTVLKLLWGMMRVEKWKSTMEQNTMSGRMKKWRHYRLQRKVGSIWNILTIVPFGSFTAQLQNESAENWMTEIPQTGYFLNRNTLLYSNIAYTFWYVPQNWS